MNEYGRGKWAAGVAATTNRAAKGQAARGQAPGKDRAAARTALAAAGPALVLLWFALVYERFGTAWPSWLVMALGVLAAVVALGVVWFVSRAGLISLSVVLMAGLAAAILTAGLVLEVGLVVLAGIVLWIGVFCVVIARVVVASLRGHA